LSKTSQHKYKYKQLNTGSCFSEINLGCPTDFSFSTAEHYFSTSKKFSRDHPTESVSTRSSSTETSNYLHYNHSPMLMYTTSQDTKTAHLLRSHSHAIAALQSVYNCSKLIFHKVVERQLSGAADLQWSFYCKFSTKSIGIYLATRAEQELSVQFFLLTTYANCIS